MADTVNNSFIRACVSGDLESVRSAILLGCDINFQDADMSSKTGLIIAAENESDLPILSIILQTTGGGC